MTTTRRLSRSPVRSADRTLAFPHRLGPNGCWPQAPYYGGGNPNAAESHALTTSALTSSNRTKDHRMTPNPMSEMNMPTDMPAMHGMFMFGTDTVFLSHMPMFTMASHMYQVVLRVTLSPDAMSFYRQQQAAKPKAVRNLAN